MAYFGDGSNLSGVSGVPQGFIGMWYGATNAIPSGWALCDGSVVNGLQTPDLRDKFVVGASDSTGDTSYPGLSPNATGGAATDTVTISGSDTVNISISGTTGVDNQTTLGQNYVHAGSGTQRRHNHSFSGSDSDTVNISGSDTVNTLPPYYALAYIIKT